MTRLKNLFATPKKAALTITCIIALVALASTITVFAARAYAENTSIGATNAEYYAFADAGVDPEAATNVETEFDYEQGQFIYDVEFYADGTKYDYWIKASDGTVVKKEAKIVNATAAAGTEETTVIAEDATVSDMGNAEETTAAAENAGTAQITLEEAKAIALEHAGVDAADATFTKTELDVDNGVSEYDIEFTANGYEYEYEVSVTSGVVLKSEREQVNASANQGTSGEKATTAAATITLDEAKVIALNNAGVSATDATFTKGKLDVDDGVTVYDIEFYTTGYEYDYEINATTGVVVKSEKEVRTVTTTKAASEQTTTTQKATEQATTTASTSQITLAEAKTIALNHAGVSASNATFTEGKLDKDDGVTVYDIEFYTTGYKYEYEINATTGAVIKSEKEARVAATTKAASEQTTTTQKTTEQATTASSSQITLAEAKTIALNHAGIAAADATFTEGKLDYDHGTSIYELEFYAYVTSGSNTYLYEYEYEINATTGAVIKSELDKEKVSSGGNSGSTLITVDEAKSIAAAHAGYSVSEVTFKKAKLDTDDGLTVYEIEFYVGNVEYEYEINASTGAVIEYEMDHD